MTALIDMFKKLLSRDDADCTATRKLASGYLEDGLSPQKRSSIQAHLEKCGPCRAFVDTLAATIEVLSRFPMVAPPPSLKQSIIDRARREGRRRHNG
ncbi:MAG TPA: zf-HC2 domain-containing protein [Dehalococcoidia bacterium]|nr:zf-HC2 domain-containing protein [Dehalococcoidia bacterium]